MLQFSSMVFVGTGGLGGLVVVVLCWRACWRREVGNSGLSLSALQQGPTLLSPRIKGSSVLISTQPSSSTDLP